MVFGFGRDRVDDLRVVAGTVERKPRIAETDTTPLLAVTALSRSVAYRKILCELSFEVHRGQAVAVIGPNGAGKTTLLRVVSGLARASSGKVHVAGTIAMVAHDPMVYDALTARENLSFFAKLTGTGQERVSEVLDLVNLTSRQHDRVMSYSRGMMQRLGIARALLSAPDLLLLDEPLNSLDESSSNAVIRIVSDLRDRGTAVLFVTHEFGAVERLATHVIILAAGKLVHSQPVDGLDAAGVAALYREVVRVA